MAVNLNKLASVQKTHRENVRRLFAGEPVASVVSIDMLPQESNCEWDAGEFPAWLRKSLDFLDRGLPEAFDETTYRPLVMEFWPLGVHFVDALFGAQVFQRDGNFWNDPLQGDLGDLRPIDVENAPLARWMFACLGQMVAAMPSGVISAAPVFASPLNIALNLFNERALIGLHRAEPSALRGMRIIADAIRSLHALVRKEFREDQVRFYASSFRWAPDGFGHICGCSTHLIGPELYARHVAALDEMVLGVFPCGGTIHLCGRHTQHIPVWRAMKVVRGVQLNDAATEDFETYFRGLREDQIIYVTPNERMPVEKIVKISGGRRIILQTRLGEPISLT